MIRRFQISSFKLLCSRKGNIAVCSISIYETQICTVITRLSIQRSITIVTNQNSHKVFAVVDRDAFNRCGLLSDLIAMLSGLIQSLFEFIGNGRIMNRTIRAVACSCDNLSVLFNLKFKYVAIIQFTARYALDTGEGYITRCLILVDKIKCICIGTLLGFQCTIAVIRNRDSYFISFGITLNPITVNSSFPYCVGMSSTLIFLIIVNIFERRILDLSACIVLSARNNTAILQNLKREHITIFEITAVNRLCSGKCHAAGCAVSVCESIFSVIRDRAYTEFVGFFVFTDMNCYTHGSVIISDPSSAALFLRNRIGIITRLRVLDRAK